MTNEELSKWNLALEKEFTDGEDGPSCNQTGGDEFWGEPYIVLTSGCVKEQGEEIMAWFSTPEKAVEEYRKILHQMSFSARQAGRNRLIWRIRPELIRREVAEVSHISYQPTLKISSLYAVYSRLAWTDKSPGSLKGFGLHPLPVEN